MKHVFSFQRAVAFLAVLVIGLQSAWAQDMVKVSGKVTAYDDGVGLPGVTVRVKETSNGVATDFDGNYTIEAPATGTLIFSFVGYTTEEIAVNNRSTIDVALMEDIQKLSEVVVVGYGTQTKREITGSIAKVEGESLTDISVPSFEAALQGKAAGVQVIQGSGLAGSGSVIRVRGIASLSAGGDPLYVIDGVPLTQDPFINGDRGGFNTNPLATINPNDIESVEILKDASAAAIYGSRGANGVILITTKRGKLGKPVFNFSSQAGISTPTRKIDLVSSEEWLQLYQEAWENDGNVGPAPLPGGLSWEEARQHDTDWMDLTTQTGIKQEYNFSFTQGTEKLSTYAGISYSDNESFLAGNSYERLSGRANIDYKILSNLEARLSTTFSRGINNRVFSGWSGGFGAAMSEALPIYPVRNPDGTYFTGGNNPIRQAELLEWRTRENRSLSSLNLIFEPVNKLKISASGSLDYMDIQDDQYEPSEWTTGESVAKRYPTWVTNYTTGLNAAYNYELNTNHTFDFLLGSEYQRSLTEKYGEIRIFNVDGPFYEDETIPERLDENGEPITNPEYTTAADQRWSFISYFGRVNYNFADKLYLKGSARVDGSSRFGENNRYGFFPSFGASYIISDADFFPQVNAINNLKLKASWGITGNADIPNYQRFGTFRRQGADEGNSYNDQPMLYPVRLANPDLKWETQRTYDFGFELGIFNNRVVADFSYFNKNSTDVLIDRLVQVSSGFERYFENIAEINNRGLELSLTTRNIDRRFKWTTELNVSRLHNEVIDIGATPPDAISGSGDTRVIEGMPVGVNYLNRFSYVDPANGLPVFLDAEGNETYEFNLADRVPVGSVVPDATGGITNTFRYGNLDLNILFTFTLGGNIYDDAAKRQLGVVSNWVMRQDIVDRWRQPGDVATFPRLTLDPNTYGGLPSFWNLNTTQFLYDASYARMRSLTLGYNLNSDFLSRLNLQSARIFFTGTNLLTFTKYPGPDPEIVRDHNGPQGRNLSPNVTYLTPPQERAFTLGVDIKF